MLLQIENQTQGAGDALAPDLRDSHWEGGHFVTRCTVCGKTMVKLPGLPWKLKQRHA